MKANASHPSAPAPSPRLPSALVRLFAVSSGLSVANVYYAQPLLDALAHDFGIEQGAVGAVITATQLGSALALLLLVPLGDRMDRRRLMAGQLLGLVGALAAVALSTSAAALLAAMTAVGLLGTAMTQGLIAYAASAASPHERGRIVGAAQGGVFIGLLLARVFSGAVSDLAGWRGVYASAAVVMLALAWPLHRRLPALAKVADPPALSSIAASMWSLLRHDRVLRTRGVLALLMFAAFNIFWSALALPLSAPPYAFSHTIIGAFGLVGVVGALAAAHAGRWVDRGWGQRTTAFALCLLLLSWWPISHMGSSLWALVVGIVLLDMGGQALHVTNQAMILRGATETHSRLIGLYMLFYAIGSGLGAMAGTATYARAGWLGVSVLGATASLCALGFWVSTLRLPSSSVVRPDNR